MIKKILAVSIAINILVAIWCTINVFAVDTVNNKNLALSHKFSQLPVMTEKAINKMKTMSKEDKAEEVERITKLYIQLSDGFKELHKSASGSFTGMWLFSIVFLSVSTFNTIILVYLLRYNKRFKNDAQKARAS